MENLIKILYASKVVEISSIPGKFMKGEATIIAIQLSEIIKLSLIQLISKECSIAGLKP